MLIFGRIFTFSLIKVLMKMRVYGGHSYPMEALVIVAPGSQYIHQVTSFEPLTLVDQFCRHVHFSTPVANYHDFGEIGFFEVNDPQ
jgi:hypothetical protein